MKKNQLRLGAVMSYINMAIGSLIPMFYTPVMLELLGQSEYGLFKLSNTITSYLSLVSFGIGSAVVRYLVKFKAADDKEGEQRMFGLFNIIFLVIAGVALVIGIVISLCVPIVYSAALSSDQLLTMQILIFVSTLNIVVGFSATPYTSVVTSHERFVFLQFINILTTVVSPVVNIIVLMIGYKSIGMTVSSLILTIIVRIAYIIYVRSSIKLKPRYDNMPVYLLKELLVFSFWVFVANVVNKLYVATDTAIIGAVPALATVGVAIYNVGTTFNAMLNNFTLGISSILTPKINEMVFKDNDNEALSEVLIRVGRLQSYIVGLICSGFVVFGRQFLLLWVGSDYSDAYWVAIFTMLPVCVPLVQTVALSIITARNRHRFRSLVYLGIAVFNVIGTIILVNFFGIIGAALMTGLANIVGQGLIMNWYYWKKNGLNIPKFWKIILRQFLIPVTLCVIFMVVLNFIELSNWVLLFVGIGIYTSIFAVMCWLFVMNDYEKDIFRRPIMFILNKFKKKSGDTN
ncbi:MAG: oligosaccharide flippase family protein [Ruminococcus sp.]